MSDNSSYGAESLLAEYDGDEAGEPSRSQYVYVSLCVAAYFVVCVVGLVVNSLSLVLFMSTDGRKKSSLRYLTALCLCDMVKLVSDLVYAVLHVLVLVDLANNRALSDSVASLHQQVLDLLAPYFHYLFKTIIPVMSWLIALVGLCRYRQLTQRPNYPRLVQLVYDCWKKRFDETQRSRHAISLSVLVGLLVALPYFLNQQQLENRRQLLTQKLEGMYEEMQRLRWQLTPLSNDSYRQMAEVVGRAEQLLEENADEWQKNAGLGWAYQALYYVVSLVAPMGLLLTVNALAIVSLRRRDERLRQRQVTQSAANVTNQQRTTRLLVSIVVVYLVCVVPECVLEALANVHATARTSWYRQLSARDSDAQRRLIDDLAELLLSLHATLNFFLYNGCNQRFRAQMRVLCCKCKPNMARLHALRHA